MDRLDVDDLYRCVQCGGWHVLHTAVTDPRDGTAAADFARWVWFECPRRGGSFYAGRIGEPPHDRSRWYRA